MKTKIILLLFLMTAINSLPAVAQAKVEQFSQPYPAGEPLVNNPFCVVILGLKNVNLNNLSL